MIMNIKNNLSYNSDKNYCNQFEKKKRQNKRLKSGFFHISKYLLYLYIIYSIKYSGREQDGTGRIYSKPVPI